MTPAHDTNVTTSSRGGAAESELPLVEELRLGPSPQDVFRSLLDRPHVLWLDSARRAAEVGRYSFVTADPFDFLIESPDASDSLADLENRLAKWRTAPVDGLPPFQGGAAGMFGYDLARQLERVPTPLYDEFSLPAIAIGFYDVVVAFDHQQQRAWIISQGFPETDPSRRHRRAARRLAEMREFLSRPVGSVLSRTHNSAVAPLTREDLAPQHAVADHSILTSDFSEPQYLDALARAVEDIRDGEIFQVNLSQRLLAPQVEDDAALYLRLRRLNPAPFAAYFDLGDYRILSASPERFLHVDGRHVETRPIKGTRRLTARAEADLFAGDDLLASEKDRAENVMIVDLLRNDLSRVCEASSMQVAELCRLETFEHVQHLVSVIRGRLRDSCHPVDLLRAAFPGGSITGAPKIRATEIIAELEPTARGAYCGALGYIGFDGAADTSILIRTITAGRGWCQAPVGGGIVAQSEPAREYEETWHKAAGLIQTMLP